MNLLRELMLMAVQTREIIPHFLHAPDYADRAAVSSRSASLRSPYSLTNIASTLNLRVDGEDFRHDAAAFSG